VSGILYILCLLVLMLGPPTAYWRRGLKASLLMVAAELAGVLVLFFALSYFGLLAKPGAPGPMPETGVLEHIRRNHAEQVAHLVALVTFLVVIPGMAALLGGMLSLIWAAARAIRRAMQTKANAST
jgi:hypothetical protein